MRNILLALGVTWLSGCAIAPGMYMDGAEFRRLDTHGQTDTQQSVFDVRLITAPLMLKLQTDEANGARGKDPAGAEAARRRQYEYRIGANDILSITVWDHPELTIPAGEYRKADDAGHLVDGQGNIFYPYIGVVHVADKTAGEIRSDLTQRLSQYIENPQLDVRVISFRNKRVYVTGEVKTPSVLPINDRPLTVLEAINLSGGPTLEADLQNVIITNGDKARTIDVEALHVGEYKRNDILKDNDQVYVSDRFANQVYVLGEVQKPSVQLMNKGKMSLAEAIGRVDGIDRLAGDASRIYVIRGDLGKPQIYQLNA
ncbi:MAG: polysaccharide biosynthesis/export family protein, partial [Candidatus Promineifilaceae bacterium]